MTRTAVAIVLAAALLVGCRSGSEDAELQAYLGAVAQVERDRAAVFARLRPDEWLAYAPRPVVLDTVPAPAPATLDDVLARADALEPPDAFDDAHRAWVDVVGTTRELADDLAAAVAAEDLAGALLAATRDTLASNVAAAQAPPELCRVTALRPDATCRTDVDPEAVLLADPLRRVMLEAGPAIGNANVVTASEEELLTYLEATQPDVEAVLAQVLDELARVDPPGEWRADTAVVTRYLEGLHDVAIRLTDAAAAGDTPAIPGAFQASTGLAEELRTGLSTQGEAALRGLLGG